MDPKILFVDDEENILSSIRRALKKEYNVFTSPGGEEGLRVLKESGPFAVVVSDLQMPGMDGNEFLARVSETVPGAVRVMLTGHADLEAAMEAVNKGNVFRFLTKPCDMDKLKKVLNEAIAYYEKHTSRVKYMDMVDLDYPLLKTLMNEAPGTYHHSSVVASLCEAGAKAIGADDMLAKVGAMYHDIGKLKNPKYFIENQTEGTNPHDELAPEKSARILVEHVTAGVEMARAHHLDETVVDLIAQHHGTRSIGFFLHKAREAAKEESQPLFEDNFQYPGPFPQSREAGLLLLADIVEASSRVLSEPTPERLMEHMDSVFASVKEEGELVESGLFSDDLEKIKKAFLSILVGTHHHRIEYPGTRETNP